MKLPSSFRDPSGFVYFRGNEIYRQFHASYEPHYLQLMDCGLYKRLVSQGLLIAHEEVSLDLAENADAIKVIKPQKINFISYPYEWCFDQLKDAALATLRIHLEALQNGMVLKDASAFNIQFLRGKPVFIDTLSFKIYKEGTPWLAYKQFCEHFLAPLALMAYCDTSVSKLLRVHLDGIPLDLASRLLPWRSRLSLGLLTHVHLHALSQKKMKGRAVDLDSPRGHLTRESIRGLAEHLQHTVEKLNLKGHGETDWTRYYAEEILSQEYLNHKKELVQKMTRDLPNFRHVWDFGANTGEFSELFKNKAELVVSWDVDALCVQKQYLSLKKEGKTSIIPLVLDLTNPTPALGWNHKERMSLVERGPANLSAVLALLHHLVIGNNIPLEEVSEFFWQVSEYLMIEFIPKSDDRSRRLLNAREDVFNSYTQVHFEEVFRERFDMLQSEKIKGSERTLYLFKKHTV